MGSEMCIRDRIVGSLFLILAMTQAVLLKNLNTQDNLNFPEQEIVLEEIDELDSLPTE